MIIQMNSNIVCFMVLTIRISNSVIIFDNFYFLRKFIPVTTQNCFDGCSLNLPLKLKFI